MLRRIQEQLEKSEGERLVRTFQEEVKATVLEEERADRYKKICEFSSPVNFSSLAFLPWPSLLVLGQSFRALKVTSC